MQMVVQNIEQTNSYPRSTLMVVSECFWGCGCRVSS